MQDRSPIKTPGTAGTGFEAGHEVPAGLTEVRLPNGIYQWLNSEQLARRREQRRAGLREAKRRRYWELAAGVGVLLLVFALAGLFVHCRVREAASLTVPQRPAAENAGLPPSPDGRIQTH